MQYFDIHSHLYFPEFDSDRSEVVSSMKENGIYTTTIGTNIETSKKAVELADQNENIFASVGVHPAHFKSDTFDNEFENLVKNPKVVCIGECGFDYFRLEDSFQNTKKVQRDLFERQIQLAVNNNKPLMLHCRPSKGSMDAYLDTLEILQSYKKDFGSSLLGNAHFFAGDQNILKKFLDIGFTVSFTGVITFTRDYDDLIRYTPDDMIHCETDAPFVSPAPFRGKRNSPENISFVVEKMAEIKGLQINHFKLNLIKNAKRLFNIYC